MSTLLTGLLDLQVNNTGEKKLSPHLEYFSQRTNIPLFYQVHLGERDIRYSDKIRMVPFAKFCQLENLIGRIGAG